MVDMFVGRESELQFLNEYYEREGSQILVVYGHRGVGKTSLIDFFSKDKKSVYYLARSCSAREQCCQWANELKDQGEVFNAFPDYQAVFQCLTAPAGTGKQVITIDEFHYFVKSDPGFMEELIRYVEDRGTDRPVMVILSTSASSWVENTMVSKIGSNALAISGLLKVREMKFQEIRRIFTGYSLTDSISIYAVLGGMPGLWRGFEQRLSAKENIIRHMLKKESRLHEELSTYMWAELREPAVYNTLLAAMAKGCNKLNDIYMHTGFSRAKICVYLKNLMELDLVEKVFSFDTKGRTDVQKGFYRISNPYVHFYFRFLFPKQSRLQQMEAEAFYASEIKDEFPRFVEDGYRKICRDRYDQGFASVGEWLGKIGSIDIVACDEDGAVTVAACSYARKMTMEDYGRLTACLKKAKIKAKNIHFYCEKGFDKALQNKADKGEILLYSISKDIN